jgi:hypothetical protein
MWNTENKHQNKHHLIEVHLLTPIIRKTPLNFQTTREETNPAQKVALGTNSRSQIKSDDVLIKI